MPLLSTEPTTFELPDLRLVGTCTYADFFNGKTELFGDTWERFGKTHIDSNLRIDPNKYFGLELYPPEFKQDRTWYYCACCEVKSFDAVYPPGVIARFIPAAKYLRFTVAGTVMELAPAFRQIYDVWLPKSGVKLAGYYDLEFYGEGFKGPCNPDSQIDILLPLA